MTWDSVPWFTGGGAVHSPEIARLVAYAATSGSEGIVSPGDLKVTAMSPPDGRVRVLSGAAIILNKAAGGTSQSYVGRNVGQDIVSIPATGTGQTASYLIMAQIKDPWLSGEPWADPADPKVGPYIFSERVAVQPGTRTVPSGVSGIPLARVDVPANTGTITDAMITPLRQLAQPHYWPEFDVQPGNSDANGNAVPLKLTDTGWTNWPSNLLAVNVPTWATHAKISITLNSFYVDGPADFNSRVNIGGLTDSARVARFDYNGAPGTAVGFVEKLTHSTYGVIDVTSLRGQINVPVRLQAMRTFADVNKGNVVVGGWEQVVFDVRFIEQAI